MTVQDLKKNVQILRRVAARNQGVLPSAKTLNARTIPQLRHGAQSQAVVEVQSCASARNEGRVKCAPPPRLRLRTCAQQVTRMFIVDT